MSSVAPCPLVTAVTQAKKELRFERLSPEWQPSAFSKYSTRFICFHTGHKRKENWKAFTLMATKCLFKILYQIYLFPHRSQKKEKLKGFHKEFFFIYLLPDRSQKNWKLEGFHLDGDKVSFQNTQQIYLFPHRPQEKENWKAFTSMATICHFKILY